MELTPLLTSFNTVIQQTGKSLPLVTLTLDNQQITQLVITGEKIPGGKKVAPVSITAHFFTGRSLIQKTPDILTHIELIFELAIIPFSQPGNAAMQEALAASMYQMETKELGVFMYQFRRNSDGTLTDAHEREDLFRTGDDAQPLLSAFVAGMYAAHRSDDNASKKLQEIIARYEAHLRTHLPQSQLETMVDQYETWKKK
jgi:hypothetical protein